MTECCCVSCLAAEEVRQGRRDYRGLGGGQDEDHQDVGEDQEWETHREDNHDLRGRLSGHDQRR